MKLPILTMDWDAIRSDLIELESEANRGRLVDLDTFEAIRDGRTEGLSEGLRRELSVALRGYMVGKS